MTPWHLDAVRPEVLGEHPQRAGQGRLSQHHFTMAGLLARLQIGQGRRAHVQYCASAGSAMRAVPTTRSVKTMRTHYCTAFIMSKIGRYIATTMPPTMTPSTTIITGSIRESSDPTATSTSSS